jgi:hypothetical protein
MGPGSNSGGSVPLCGPLCLAHCGATHSGKFEHYPRADLVQAGQDIPIGVEYRL